MYPNKGADGPSNRLSVHTWRSEKLTLLAIKNYPSHGQRLSKPTSEWTPGPALGLSRRLSRTVHAATCSTQPWWCHFSFSTSRPEVAFMNNLKQQLSVQSSQSNGSRTSRSFILRVAERKIWLFWSNITCLLFRLKMWLYYYYCC